MGSDMVLYALMAWACKYPKYPANISKYVIFSLACTVNLRKPLLGPLGCICRSSLYKPGKNDHFFTGFFPLPDY